MYTIVLSLKRENGTGDLKILQTEEEPEKLFFKKNPSRMMVSKMLGNQSFDSFTVEQVQSAEMVKCINDNEIVRL